jgi:hypothetical protein
MAEVRPFALVGTVDQWLRCAHEQTALDAEKRWVELAAAPLPGASATPGRPPEGPAGGMAFDSRCRLYRSRPEIGQIESELWRTEAHARFSARAEPFELFPSEASVVGDFMLEGAAQGALSDPRGLAVTGDRLYVAEAGKNRVLVYDLFDRRLRAVIPTAPEGLAGPRPIDIAVEGDRVYVLTAAPARLFVLVDERIAGERDMPSGMIAPTRVAARGQRVALLDPPAQRVWIVGETTSVVVDPHATDLEFTSDEEIVVAGWPGENFRRHRFADPQPTRPWLRAPGYDGRGIVRTPDSRIAFYTARGLRLALQDRPSYVASGLVTSFRLDSGEWQTTWGRLFVDACVPEGTSLRVSCVVADEPPEGPELARTLPSNAAAALVPYGEHSPPMPPLSLLPSDDGGAYELHRRGDGREIPWAPVAEDGFATFEGPVMATPGRYLWVRVYLEGNTRVTPRVRSLRVEYPAHDTLRHLPKVFSAEPGMASFLTRYLAPLEGLLAELDAKAFQRAALLDPDATPEEWLPWLANFLGLVLDDRFARAPRAGGAPDGASLACHGEKLEDAGPAVRYVDARRELIRNAACLFRLRGTVEGLRRFIEIYVGRPVVILERFRVRGLGGAVLGQTDVQFSSGFVGTLRVGGAIGAEGSAPLEGSVSDAFRTHAHRFSVIVPAVFSDEELDVVRHIIEMHRPAHTLFELCTVGAGMRLGVGTHVGLSSFIGAGSGFARARLGESIVGSGVVVGMRAPELALGARQGAIR